MNFPFLCFDTEDNSKELGEQIRGGKKGVSMFDKKVTQIAAITAEGKRYYNKGDVKDFLRWLNQQPEKYVYALNIQYDLGNLFGDELDSLDCTLVGGRMIKAALGDKVFVDVFNIWQMGVAALGEVFDLKKLETEDMAGDKEYVFRDVEIIREAMLYAWKFAAEMGLDEVPPTLGSLGVRLWKHWGGETIHESHEICRDAIYGGRVELFKQGNTYKETEIIKGVATGSVAYTDINSLYPFAMSKEFPGQLEDTGKELKRLGVAQVTMRVPECEIAVLPFRDERGRILYPWGKFTGVWTIPEIRAAEANGAKILKVHTAFTTDEGFYPYRDYMQRIYKIRKDSTSKAEKGFYKLLMNTLFGRTGSSGEIGRTVMQTEKNKDSGVPYGCRVLTKYKMPLGDEVNWSHTAQITSYGRLELLKYLKIVGADKMIYCDTDSVIFDCLERKFPFPTGDELGEMKIEQMCSVCRKSWHPKKDKCPGSVALNFWDIAIPWAPKQYRLGDTWKAKGVPKKMQREFIETGKACYDMPFKFREAVNFYDRGNQKKLSVWREIEKHNNCNYDKKELRNNRFFPLQIKTG